MYTFSEKWRTTYGSPSLLWPSSLAAKCGLKLPLPFASAINLRSSIIYATYSQYITSSAGRYARMINRDGYIVNANATYVRAAIDHATWNWTLFTAHLIDTPGPSWPINYFYYMALRKNTTNCGGSRGAIDWLTWSMTEDRPRVRTEESGYATLPTNLTSIVINRMRTEIYCHDIPAFISFQKTVGVLIPETGTSNPFQVQVWKDMINFAVAKLNTGNITSTKGMRNWKIDLVYADSQNTQADALLQTTTLINKGVRAVVGEFSDLLTNTVQVVLAGVSMCQLSPETEGERPKTLLDSSQLIRMREAATSQSSPIVSMIKRIGWDQVTVLFTTDEDSVTVATKVMQEALLKNVSVQRIALTTLKDQYFIEGELLKIKESGARVIISCIPNESLEYILEIAYKVGIVDVGYNWMFVSQSDPIEEKPILGESSKLIEKLEGALYFSMKSGKESPNYTPLVNEVLALDPNVYPALIEQVKETNALDTMEISIYDLIMTLGTAYAKIIDDLTDFEVEEHEFHEICPVIREQVKIEGLRGHTEFTEEGDGLIDYIVWNYQKQKQNIESKRGDLNTNDGSSSSSSSSSSSGVTMGWIQTGVYKSSEDSLSLDSNVILSGGDLDSPPEDSIPPTDEVVKFEMGDPLTTAGIVFTVVAELVVIYFLVEVSHFQKRKVFRAASLFFLRLVLLGAAIGFGANLMVVLPVSKSSCVIYSWLSWIGFTLVFGGLYAKTYRIWKIFTNSKLEVLQLGDGKLLQTTLAIFSIDGILMILWHSIDTPYVTTTGKYYEDGKTAEYCTSEHENVWLTLYLIPFFGLLIGLSFVSFRIRNLQSKFNESKQLALAIYHFTFCFIVSLSLSIALHQFLEFQAAVRFFGIYVGELGLLCIIYVPKIWLCYFDPVNSDTMTLESINSRRTFSKVTTKHTTTSKSSTDSV
eukprot:TRINITY_DN522_c0_g1_i2.p1 TRINITY_DN522_c0_g1~~TRINITY_DN522_c0_g1_i2.p1  ORF type:complete len:927 (-),score=187.83 TRINITY_DN522_c0_g1_i2:216-2996(-)